MMRDGALVAVGSNRSCRCDAHLSLVVLSGVSGLGSLLLLPASAMAGARAKEERLLSVCGCAIRRSESLPTKERASALSWG